MGLKYCGGCNPHYDRVAVVDHLKARLGREVEWASPEAGDVDLVLAIEGCDTACADLSLFEGNEIRIITCPEEAEAFIREMQGGCQALVMVGTRGPGTPSGLPQSPLSRG